MHAGLDMIISLHKAQRLICASVVSAWLAFAATPSLAENRQDEQELYNQLTLFGDVLKARCNYADAPDKELLKRPYRA